MRRPHLDSTAQYIAWHARNMPDATAIVEDARFISYGALAADLVRCVHAVEAFGVARGMVIGVETPGRYQHLLLLLACEAIGAGTASFTRNQVASGDPVMRHCDVILVSEAPPKGSAVRTIVLAPDWYAGRADLGSSTVLERAVDRDAVARIVTTSGTSGAPKAMALTFANQQSRIAKTIQNLPDDLPSRPCLLCLYHLSVGLIHRRVLSVLQLGGTVLFTVGRHAWPLIEAGAVQVAAFTIGDVERMIGGARPPPEGQRLHLTVFGAAFTPTLRQEVRRRLRATIESSYASNETNLIAMMDDDNVGTICPGVEVRIVGEDGKERGPGETGRIHVRTETMVSGYLDDSALTRSVFVDGWFQTSDMGVMPEPGRLIVLGRADDMLNIGGVKVPRSAVEDEIRRIDGVSDAVVMRMGDATEAGTLLAAVETGDDTPADLERRVGAIVSKYVGVYSVLLFPVLPRGKSGKIARAAIEMAFHQRNGHAAG